MTLEELQKELGTAQIRYKKEPDQFNKWVLDTVKDWIYYREGIDANRDSRYDADKLKQKLREERESSGSKKSLESTKELRTNSSAIEAVINSINGLDVVTADT